MLCYDSRERYKIMENLILVVVDNESDAFEMFHQLKQDCYTQNDYTILQAAVFHKLNNEILYKDGFNNQSRGLSFLSGGLIGALVGSILGPFGIVLGSSIGIMSTSFSKAFETVTSLQSFQAFNNDIENDEYGIMIHLREIKQEDFDTFVHTLQVKSVKRYSIKEAYQDVALADQYNSKLKEQTIESVLKQKVDTLEVHSDKLKHEAIKKAHEMEASAQTSFEHLEQSIHDTIHKDKK